MDRGVAHDAALSDQRGAGFELRLDERHQLGVLSGERERRRQYRREPDKARIAGDDVDRLGNVGAGQVTRVQPFENDDSRILAQFPGELAMTDIDGVDAPRDNSTSVKPPVEAPISSATFPSTPIWK